MSNDSKINKKERMIVYALSRASRCYNCDRKLLADEIVELNDKIAGEEVRCSSCAGFDHLEILLSGQAQITRLARKYSNIQYTILKWSDLWKTYERKGILVEPQAIDRAQKETGIQIESSKKEI